jgi:hypothetical protein
LGRIHPVFRTPSGPVTQQGEPESSNWRLDAAATPPAEATVLAVPHHVLELPSRHFS